MSKKKLGLFFLFGLIYVFSGILLAETISTPPPPAPKAPIPPPASPSPVAKPTPTAPISPPAPPAKLMPNQYYESGELPVCNEDCSVKNPPECCLL